MSRFTYYADYLALTGDPHVHFFEVADSPYRNPMMCGSSRFGPETYPLTIIDQFDGKRPALFNAEFLALAKARQPYDLQFVQTIVLDSHIASELHNYRSGTTMRGDVRGAIEAFLDYVSAAGCDYNPVFYFMESYCKSAPEVFAKYATPVAASLLYLHAMDEDTFIASKQITPKPDALAYYYEKYGANTLEECAHKQVERFIATKEFDHLKKLIDFSYACLLKMVLIHKRDKRPAHKKLEDFKTFCLSELGVLMGREVQIAGYYFAELAGKLVSVQVGSDLKNAKRDLLATAWDLFLLRFPEQLLDPRHLPEMNLAYVCTAEKKLSDLGQLFAIDRVAARSDDTREVQPVVSMDPVGLRDKLGGAVTDHIIQDSQDLVLKRLLEERRPALSHVRLTYLIADLEIQLSYLCKR